MDIKNVQIYKELQDGLFSGFFSANFLIHKEKEHQTLQKILSKKDFSEITSTLRIIARRILKGILSLKL